MKVEPSALDVGTLALFVGHAFAESVQRELAAAGFGDARFSHGFVFQHLLVAPRSASELAGLLGVTQQAASKSVAELSALGYVEVAPDEGDARRKSVRLSARGRAVVERARRVRSTLEATLVRQVGPRRMAACKRVLSELLEALGGAEAVRRRRVRAPR